MIHRTAIIHPKAKLAKDVSVGPHTIIGEHVSIGANTKIGSNCLIDGHTKIGRNCEIFTGAIIGSISQDKKYKGGLAYLEIGDRNKIREYATINLSTDSKDKTLIGDDNFIMAYAHIAHNCKIGNNITLANASTLAGHVIVEDKAVIGGLTAVHQFVRIGRLAIVGGCSKVVQDIIPYSMADGHPARVYGINSVGLDRTGIKTAVKSKIKKAFKILFSGTEFQKQHGPLKIARRYRRRRFSCMKLNTRSAIAKIKQAAPGCKEVSYLIKFINSSKRGIAR